MTPTILSISSVASTRIEPAYNAILAKSLINKENDYFVKTMPTSELAIFRGLVCILEND